MVGDCFVAGNSPGKYAYYHTDIEYLTMILVQRMASLFESELVSYDVRDDLFAYRIVFCIVRICEICDAGAPSKTERNGFQVRDREFRCREVCDIPHYFSF